MKKMMMIAGIALITSCNSNGSSSPTLPVAAKPTDAPSYGGAPLSSLIQDSLISKEEQQLRDILRRQIALTFPVRLGVLFYQSQTRLKEVDQQALVEKSLQEVKASGLVKEAIQIPSSLVQANASMDAVRQLASRFQVDILLIISSQHETRSNPVSASNFLEMFSDRQTYRSAVKVDAIALDIFSGAFLDPYLIRTEATSASLDPTSPTYTDATYAIRTQAEEEAWTQLKTRFIASLEQLKNKSIPAPSASPIPAIGGQS